MNKVIFEILATVLVLCMTTAAFALDVPLTYVRQPEGRDAFLPFTSTKVQATIQRPAGDWELPELKSKPPIYAFARFGDKERLVILDRQNADDFFYSRLYFDANGNNDLTDDPVIDGGFGGEDGEFCYAVLPSVDTMIEIEGKSLPYCFRAHVFYSYFGDYGRPDKQLTKENIDENMTFEFRSNCFYSGGFELDGSSYGVALGDTNVNGRFNDRFPAQGSSVEELVEAYGQSALFSGSDHFYLATGRQPEARDVQVCGNLLLVDGRLFDVNISTPEGKMTLKPVTESLVPLNLPMATERMTVYTEDGRSCLMMYRPGNEAMIPRGKYRLLGYTVLRKDEQGDEWFLAAAATADISSVTVDGSTHPSLRFGEPYVPVIELSEAAKQGVREGATQVRVGFIVEGGGKERLADLSRVSGNRTRIELSAENPNRPKEPTYKIVQPDGQIVAQGSFEYG